MRMKRLHVERVVVRDEGLGRGAADERVHRRRLDLEKAAVVEDSARSSRTMSSARAEHVGDLGVGDEIDVALAVAVLDVGEAVPLLGQRAQRLGEQADRRRLDRELAGLGHHGHALGLDDVGDVDFFERARTSSPSESLRQKSCISPCDRAGARRLALPKPRTATTRPATCTGAARAQARHLGRVVLSVGDAGLAKRARKSPSATRGSGEVVGERVFAARPKGICFGLTRGDDGLFGALRGDLGVSIVTRGCSAPALPVHGGFAREGVARG